jgi:hypothetical protein
MAFFRPALNRPEESSGARIQVFALKVNVTPGHCQKFLPLIPASTNGGSRAG